MRALALGALAAALTLAACDDTNPPSPLPATPDPGKPATLAPSTYLLRADQMGGYTRSASSTISPGSLGDDAGDPSLAPTLTAEGMQYGTRYTYAEPANVTTLPFSQVISEAILFNDSAGAQHFFADESLRRNVAPSGGGTVATVGDLSAVNADAVIGFSAKAPPAAAATTTPPQTWLAVVRRGRVVVELLGSGSVDTATRSQFNSLLAQQESLLSVPPPG